MSVYKDMFPTLGGYLTDKGQLHFPRIELFIQEISRREPLYFQQRAIEDKERPFATPEYRDHYYKMKFQLEPEDIEGKRKIVKSYLEGLAWVLTYYYHGCGSWTWYYPYLYAPLGSDLRNLSDISVGFDKGRPFTPLLQLLSVLPPQSANFLPSSYADLMINPSSNLSPYYPRDFTVDANGKKAPWECVVQIPFINEKMLIDTVNTIDHAKELTPKQQMINRGGKEHAYKPSDFKESFQKNAGKKQMINSDVKGTWGSALDDQYIAATRQYSPGSSRSGGGNGGGGSGYRGGNGGGRGGQSSGRSPR